MLRFETGVGCAFAFACASACASAIDVDERASRRERTPHEERGEHHEPGIATPYDHCVQGQKPDPRDRELSGEPDEWLASTGEIDLVLPEAVLEWMDERVWKATHDAWHNVRRCRPEAVSNAPPEARNMEVCAHTELIPEDQQCENAGDGYQFLVMHRHMLQSLRQAFPEHPELFAGFPSFPYEVSDVPEQWRDRWGSGWAPSVLETAELLEDIESHLDRFPTDGDLGQYIQCASGRSAIHGALHFKWVVNESPNSLGKQTVNLGNYMFWKLHGWIDDIWERYRVAKGLTPEEPALVDELVAQCREMHALRRVVINAESADVDKPLPRESGVFHEQVRPILEQRCSGCHSEASPEGKMSLGGHISSADIVRGLIDVPAMHGGQYLRIVPGDPERSWLYLKLTGQAEAAGCEGMGCRVGVMPPAGEVTVPESEREVIRSWIESGAAAPQALPSED